MDHAIGLYLCSGCHLGDALDLPGLEKLARSELKLGLVRIHPCLCERAGTETIRRDVETAAVNTVVVGACSSRVNGDVFAFGPAVLVERINLREQVAWCRPPNDEKTQSLAEDYLRMGIARARKVDLVSAHVVEPVRSVLVLGGGLSGMSAAREIARAGYRVHLVERESALGGWSRRQHRTFPRNPPYTRLMPPDPSTVIQGLERDPAVTIHLESTTAAISGSPGAFEVTIQRGDSVTRVHVGAIVMATGSRPYDPSRLNHLGHGLHPGVVTANQFELMAKTGRIVRPTDGSPARDVVFIQCAGSRDAGHLPYCSSDCCLTSLKQAAYVRESGRDNRAYVIYRDMRTPGHFEEFYATIQQDEGIFLTKGEVTAVAVDTMNRHRLTVAVEGTLLGGNVLLSADLVVLATGQVPNAVDGEAIRAARDKLALATAEHKDSPAESDAAAILARLPQPILNLAYRQGPDLPLLSDGFPDSHFVCFPYESRRTGIYPCGTARRPMLESECLDDASGAALKAIQCIELIARGESALPRAGDRSWPDLFLQRCTQCKRCTEECPFGMYDEDEKGTPKPNITRCRRCGICMGSCPERIISFSDYSVDIIGSMVKAIEVPEEDEEKPRIVAFICENDALPVVDLAGLKRARLNPWVRFIPVRCLGSFNIVWIADALSKGIDGILLLGCKHGDDYQCHFISGSRLADERMGKVQETLTRLRLERERILVEEISLDEVERLPRLLDDFAAVLDTLGPNPYKDL